MDTMVWSGPLDEKTSDFVHSLLAHGAHLPHGMQMREPSLRRGQRGVTLMEAMVALAIFTVGVLGMTALQIHATRGLETAGAITMAANLGTNALDELRVTDFATLSNGTRHYDRYGMETDSPDYYSVSTAISGGSSLKTVTVTAAWTEGTFERDVRFQTRIAR